MTSKKFPPELIQLANSVGQFIQYWGFKELHGQIWCLVYLSEQPLSGQDLAHALGMSKASISLAIQELVFYEVIFPVRRGRGNTLYYQSNPHIYEVICHILKNRELKLIHTSAQALAKLNALPTSCRPQLNSDHLKELETMISKATTFLEFLIASQCHIDPVIKNPSTHPPKSVK
ncbi:MAG: hypothetical protein NZ480_06520 [Bdellovibrionaceae bacterium]|nr:hypothetical protein [Pseudobdellovibrionaceae bacterium]MDW8189427.1 hypothetical protein [Pseudobdellovibrionaceae bacterium]